MDLGQDKPMIETTGGFTSVGLALNVVGLGLTGVLIVSGLPQVEDHLLGVEIITEYLARKGEQQ